MAAIIPQVITPDRATGAQVIDGSLKFDATAINRLDFTNSGSSTTFTASMWVKRHGLHTRTTSGTTPTPTALGYQHFFFTSDTANSNSGCGLGFDTLEKITVYNGSHNVTTRVFRDTSSWYHLVLKVTSGTAELYVNNELAKSGVTGFELSDGARIGDYAPSGAYPSDISMSQVYVIDGQALGPEEFGFTDPLTNTWKPKKYTGDFNNLPDINLAGTGSGESIEVVINRQVNKAWIKNNGSSVYEGGGDPSDPLSAPSFHLPSGGSLYWFTTAYDSAHTMVIGSSSETGNQPEWASGGTTGSLTRDSATQVSGTPSSSYASARTDALADDTIYAFTFTITTGASGNHTGWFLSTSSSYSSGTPDEQTSGNTVGARFFGNSSAYYPYVAVYGSFATANPNTLNNSIPKLSFRGKNSFYLPFDGNSPIGEDQSGIVTPNDGTTWSNFSEDPDSVKNSGAATELFNGNLSTGGVVLNQTTTGSDQWYVALDGVSIPCAHNVAFYSGNGASTATMRINGNDTYKKEAGSTSVEWQYLPFTGTITKIELGYLDGSGSTNTFYGIKVDGTILIDAKKGNDWTPLNFGSNSLEKATGAKPILNTLGGVAAGVGVFGSKENVVHTISSSSGGGNPYIFDNEGTQPTLNLLRGATYTFDYTAATSHPLYFSSLSDGKHNSKAYSVEFNGSSQYLTVPAHADLNYGTGDFTIEWFQWWDDAPSSYESVYSNNYATNPNLLIQSGNGTTTYTVYMNGTGASVTETTAGPTGKWVHYAVVRSGTLKNNVKIYRDGRVTGKGTYTGAVGNDSSPVYIAYDQTYYFDGKISNLRAVKGTAVYTEEFNPPTTTLTNITNTVLLCCQDSSAGTAAVIPTGSITVSGSAAATNSYNPFVYDNNHGNYGIDTGTSNTTKITVPHNGVDTLYYYCANHSGMGNSINVTTDETKTDPYAWRNYLALPLTGISTDISHQVNCTSTRKIDTVSGPSPYGDKGQRTNFYDSSHHWNVNSDTLQYAQQGDELVLGTDDFTIECWVYDDNGHDGNSSRRYIFDNRVGGSVTGDPPQIAAYVDGHSEWNVYIGNPVVEIIKDTVATTHINRWQHFAVTRENGIVRMFVNGIELGSAKSTTNFTNNGIGVGRAKDANYGWSGNIQDFRVYKGVAKYTSNFIPASTQPDILPDTPSGVSGSSELVKIADGSSTFSGIGVTHLSVADSADFTMGSGEWTMECFVYPQTPSSNMYQSLIQKYATTATDSSWFWSLYAYQTLEYATQNFYFYEGDGTAHAFTSQTTKISLDQWHHLAVVRDSNTIRTYINGVQDGTISLGGSLSMNDTTCDVTIGADSANNYAMTGSISNARVIKGTCLYPDGKSFTPPTQPLTTTSQGATDSEVKLLCCQSNATSGAAAKSPNISGVNDGTVWSNNVTYSGNVYSGGDNIFIPELAFNGLTVSASDYDTNAMGPYTSGVVTFNFPGTFSGNLKIQGRLHSGDTVKVNGSSISHTGNGSYSTFNLGSVSNLASLSITGSSGNVSLVGQILLDDVVLIDPIISTRSDGPQMANVANTFNPFDTDIHTIRGQENNYATWNPLLNNVETGANGTLFNGNLEVEDTVHGVVLGNTLMTSGKWYFEAYIENGNMMIGVMGEDYTPNTQSYNWNKAAGIYPAAPQFVEDGSFVTSPRPNTGAVSGTKAWYGVAVDIDNRKMWIRKDGIWVHNNPLSTNADVTLDANSPGFYAWFHSAAQDGNDCTANFGQKPFKFPPPDGFQPLTAANTRPVKVISRPDQYVGIATWTGDGTDGSGTSNDRTVTGLSLKPDLVWCKIRTQSYTHVLWDSVRGSGSNKQLQPNETEAEGSTTGNGANTAAYGYISEFTSDGFKTLTGSSDNDYFDRLNDTYVAWCWKAGGNKNTFNVDDVGYASAAAAGITGLDGTGEMTTAKFLGCSIGTKQGFSIIKYRGLGGGDVKVPHGLSQTPDMVMVKNLDSSVDWAITHSGLPGNRSLRFTTDSTSTSGFLGLNKGGLASTYFTINYTDTNLKYVNANNEDYIAYCWHDVPGLQKFGSYVGNSSTDGPFIELGFRPALVMLKAYVAPSTSVTSWVIQDSERGHYNVINSKQLYANANYSEGKRGDGSSTNPERLDIDFLSNGFKLRDIGNEINATSYSYIYAAWAEAPSIGLYGGGANAR